MAFARGATTIENNTSDGVGLFVTAPNANAPVTVSYNEFSPVATDIAALFINNNWNTSSPVTVENNTFAVPSGDIGVLSGDSTGRQRGEQ